MPMPAHARKTQFARNQKSNECKSTTVRIPKLLCEETRTFVSEGVIEIDSFNEFVVDSLRQRLRSLRKKSVDEAFKGMATDKKYQAEMQKISGEFEASDWHSISQIEKR